TADSLRAVALAELGRMDQARELCAGLETDRRLRRRPVVGYALARVAEIDGRRAEAIERVERALRSRGLPAAARRDLRLLGARCLAGLARHNDAVRALAELASDGFAREVEQLGHNAHARGETALALAARQALSDAAPYR